MGCIIYNRFISESVCYHKSRFKILHVYNTTAQTIYSSTNGTDAENANAFCSTQSLVAVAALWFTEITIHLTFLQQSFIKDLHKHLYISPRRNDE